MNAPDDLPPPSPRAMAFLKRHASTGEPSKEDLTRGLERLTSRVCHPGARETGRARWLMPELMALAAVVLLLVGGQTLWVHFKPAPIIASPVDAGTTSAPEDVAALFTKATNAKQAGLNVRSHQLATRVLQLEPGHPGATALLKELSGISRDIYLRAYMLRETRPDEALKLFDEVVSITEPGDEYHEKAMRHAAELRAR